MRHSVCSCALAGMRTHTSDHYVIFFHSQCYYMHETVGGKGDMRTKHAATHEKHDEKLSADPVTSHHRFVQFVRSAIGLSVTCAASPRGAGKTNNHVHVRHRRVLLDPRKPRQHAAPASPRVVLHLLGRCVVLRAHLLVLDPHRRPCWYYTKVYITL